MILHPDNRSLLDANVCYCCGGPLGKGYMCILCIKIRKGICPYCGGTGMSEFRGARSVKEMPCVECGKSGRIPPPPINSKGK